MTLNEHAVKEAFLFSRDRTIKSEKDVEEVLLQYFKVANSPIRIYPWPIMELNKSYDVSLINADYLATVRHIMASVRRFRAEHAPTFNISTHPIKGGGVRITRVA